MAVTIIEPYTTTFEKEEMAFKEWYKKSDCELTGVSIGIARCIFHAGAESRNDNVKELQKENKQLAKRICELQSDLSKAKSTIEKMKRCSNCNHYNRIYELCQYSLGDKDYHCRNRKWELAE